MSNKDGIEEYSMDYRGKVGSEDEFKSYNRPTKKVVASSPAIVSHKAGSKEGFNVPTGIAKTNVKNDIYVNMRGSVKTVVYKVLFGCLVLVLATVGGFIFFTTLNQSVDTKIVNSGNAEDYANFLAPVVMHDPEPFECPEKADKLMVLSSGIWRAILQNGTQQYNSFDERGFSLMPISDIEKACKALFGSDYKINTSERIFGPFYTFEPGENNFHISAISNQNNFLPYVKSVKQDEDTVTLTVGYFLREDNFLKDKSKIKEPNFIKIIKYILKADLTTHEQYIYAVEEVK